MGNQSPSLCRSRIRRRNQLVSGGSASFGRLRAGVTRCTSSAPPAFGHAAGQRTHSPPLVMAPGDHQCWPPCTEDQSATGLVVRCHQSKLRIAPRFSRPSAQGGRRTAACSRRPSERALGRRAPSPVAAKSRSRSPALWPHWLWRACRRHVTSRRHKSIPCGSRAADGGGRAAFDALKAWPLWTVPTSRRLRAFCTAFSSASTTDSLARTSA